MDEQRSGDDRRRPPRGGRRQSDQAWTVTQLAAEINMSSNFIRTEIETGELRASKFGREYRIAYEEVARYLTSKGWPAPPASSAA